MSRALMLLAAAALLGLAAAQTTNLTRYDGFSYAGNVIGYVNMTIDYCDIKAAIAAGNWTAAAEIYATGKNSFSGVSKRTFFRFASYAPTAAGMEMFHDALTMGRNSSWLDSSIKEAMAAKNGPLTVGLIQVGALKYMLHEVDEGYNKVAQYLADMNLTNLVSDAAGAPHNVDEAFALWAGGAKSDCGTLSGWAASLGADLQTTFLGKSYINSAMTLAMNELLATSRMMAGTLNLPAYEATRGMVQRYVTMLGLQGVLHSAYKAHAAVACDRPAADLAEAKSMIVTHWTYLYPMLVARGVPASRTSDLMMALTAARPHYTKTRNAVKSVVSAMGRRMSEIGTPRHERVVGAWAGCDMHAMH